MTYPENTYTNFMFIFYYFINHYDYFFEIHQALTFYVCYVYK